MNYIFKIIDTQRDDLTTLIEKAVGGSVVLEWMGGDTKDGRSIVGSRLSFTMVGMSMADGQYSDLFTGDETRYRVTMEDETGTLIWQGFLLPDSYSEPYSNAPILVDFTATDGLGRLKGKYLPDEFYEDEKSVIEILAKCLELTGLDLDFRFAPAIENHLQKDYNLIYIDTRLYKEKEKRQDAYKILNDLLESMLCTVYQAENHFNIEGVNIRNRRVYEAKIYDYLGTYLRTDEITRILKEDLTVIATPTITMQPPYGTVEITHKREDVSFPTTLSTELNDGWVTKNKTVEFVYPTDWFGMNDFYAIAAREDDREDLTVKFGKGTSEQYITLRNKPYVKKGEKYLLELDFGIRSYSPLNQVTKEVLIDAGFWTNPFNLAISVEYNDGVFNIINYVYANYMFSDERYIEQQFENDEKCNNKLEFIAPESGVLNIEIFAVEDIGNQIEYIAIEKCELETIAFNDEMLSSIELTDEYTVKKELELVWADDATGFSKGFRLKKLRSQLNSNTFDIVSSRQFERQGYWYSVVQLWEANLIADNIKDIESYLFETDSDELEPVLEVIYNFNQSEEHVFKTLRRPNPEIAVYVYDYNTIKENRDYWEQWSDSIYKVDKARYTDVVATIHNRLFDIPVPKVDFDLLENIKFNDFLGWRYKDTSQWMLTNCKWYIDKGRSSITGIETYYAVKEGENIPPIVNALPDFHFDGTLINLTSEAYDPDGFIVSYLWEIVSGFAIIHSPNSQNTQVTIDTDYAEFKVTVTDNDGATAFDTVKVYRNMNILARLVTLSESDGMGTYQMDFEPNISEGAALNINGSYNISLLRSEFASGYAYFKATLNGTIIKDFRINPDLSGGSQNDGMQDTFSINYFNGDVLIFEIGRHYTYPDSAYAEFKINEVSFVEGTGEVTGTPLTKYRN